MKIKENMYKRMSLIITLVLAFNVVFSSTVVRAEDSNNVKLSVLQGYNADVVLTLGDSIVDATNFKQDLTAKLNSMGVDNSRIRINAMKVNDISVQDTFASNVYDHIGNWGEQAYPNGDQDPRGGKYNKHIIVKNDGKNIVFYGYGQPAFKDFMFMPNENKGKKTFTFDINESGINYHSMEGAGFLFNSQIVNGKLSGYSILFAQAGIQLFKISNVDASAFHENQSQVMSSYPGVTKLMDFQKSNSTSHNIKIDATPDKIDMWDNGIHVIDNFKITEYFGNGFGPMASYNPHGCPILSYFTFDNLKMQSTQVKMFKDVIREPEWMDVSKRFVVNLDDNLVPDFEDPSYLSEVLMRLANEDIHYVGWGTSKNKDQALSVIQKNSGKGTFADNKDYPKSIDEIATYIYNQLNQDKDNSNYITIGRPVDISISPDEFKMNSATKEYPNGRWKIAHNEQYFENSMGKINWDNQYLDSMNITFDKVGEYTASFQDQPIDPNKIYAHRMPIANFNAAVSQQNGIYGTEITDASYDLDKVSSGDKGISQFEWKWKEINDLNWNEGKIPSTVEANKHYLIQLRVKDYQNTWSYPAVRYISTTPSESEKPIANFNISSQLLYKPEDKTISILDSSYDPQGKQITEYEWTVLKNGTQIYKGATPMSDFSAQEVGVYTIQLRVKTSVWSETYSRVLTIQDAAADVEADKDSAVIGYAEGDNKDSVTKDITLPTLGKHGSTIRWSSDKVFISSNGVVKRPSFAEGDAKVNVTATITKGNVSDVVNFVLNVVKLPNTAPIVKDITMKSSINSKLFFKEADFKNAYSDVDGNELGKIQITELPTKGILKVNDIAITLNQEIQASDLEKIVYLPDSNWIGTTSFKWKASDGSDYSKDEALGNIEIVDDIAPVVTNVSIKSSNENTAYARTGDKVILTFSTDEALAVKPSVTISGHEAAVENTSGNNYTAEYIFTDKDDEGIVIFNIHGITDKFSNITKDITITTDQSNVIFDRTAPIVTEVANNGVYNKDVNPKYNEGIAKLNGVLFTNGNAVSNEGEYSLVVTDNAGNKTTVNFKIDKTAPIITGVKDNEIYSSPVHPSINEGTATLNGKPFTSGTEVTEDGSYTIIATDEAGNTSTVHFAIDKTPPVITNVIDGGFYNTNVMPKFNEGTGLLNGKPFTSGDTVSDEGKYQVIVTDPAGNKSSVTFTIDKTAPVIAGVKDKEEYNKDVTPTFDEGTGTLNGRPFTSGDAVKEEGQYKLVVTDKAGNTSTVSFTVDKTPPVITGVKDNTVYKTNVIPSFNEGTALLDGKPFTSGTPVEGEGKHELVVKDAAGNTTKISFTIDKTLPDILGLYGKVIDNTGKALPGTIIKLSDLNNKVLDSVTTDEVGNYRFKARSVGSYKIFAEKSGFSVKTLEVNLRPEKPTDVEKNVDIVLTKYKLIITASPTSLVGDGNDVTTLKAQLLDENNKPVSGKTITFITPFGTFENGSSAVTDKDGTASVVLRAPKLTGSDMQTAAVTAKVSGSDFEFSDQLLLQFAPGSIEGVVIDNNTGKPVEGAEIVVSKDFNNDNIVDFYAKMTTGSNGKYKIAIPKGNTQYDVKITKPVKIGTSTQLITFNQKCNAGAVTESAKESYTSNNTIAGLVMMKNPDGTSKLIEDYSNYSIELLSSDSVKGNKLTGEVSNEAGSKGMYNISGLEKNKTYVVAVYYKLADGSKIIVGKANVKVDSDGQMIISTALIDPYGIITDEETGKIISGADVKLYYADTKRNRDKGIKPNTIVNLPNVKDFPPADNLNPQVSDVNGNYAYMVFPYTDYYVVVTKDGYDKYVSDTISVDETIVKHDIKMKPIKKPAVLVKTGSAVDSTVLELIGSFIIVLGAIIFKRKS